MKGKGRRVSLLAAVSVLVLGISIFALIAGRGRYAVRQGEERPSGKPRVEIGTNKVVGYSPQGEVMFEAGMEGAEYDRDAGIARLWGVTCYIMEGGRPVSAVEAQRLEFFLEQNRAVFGGVVRAWSEKQGSEIRCEDLVWEVGEKRLWSDKPAKFRRGKVTMEGSRVEADLGLRRVSLYDGARFVAEFKGRRR